MNIRDFQHKLLSNIWDVDIASLPHWRGWLTRLLRIAHVILRDLADGMLNLRAMSLVYTTLLSLVPLIAVSFSVLKAFGVHNQVEPMLLAALAPLGDKGIEISMRIISFVENMKAGVLGSVGLALLFYTVVSLIQKIERAFNYTWRVSHHRPFAQRFSDYLSVVIIGPVLVFSAIGITASITNTAVVQHIIAIEPFGTLFIALTKILPYALIIIAFTAIYSFIPNTRVRIRSAFAGAVVAGIMWETAGWAFASFVVTSAKYTAIYSALATLIFFMVWLYVGWLILLTGASIAFYHQHPEYMTLRRHDMRLSNRMKEKLALLIMMQVGKNYYQQLPACSRELLSQRYTLPMEIIDRAIDHLLQRKLLVETSGEPPGYLPGRSLEKISLHEILDSIREAGEADHFNINNIPTDAGVDSVLQGINQAINSSLANTTLKDLVTSENIIAIKQAQS